MHDATRTQNAALAKCEHFKYLQRISDNDFFFTFINVFSQIFIRKTLTLSVIFITKKFYVLFVYEILIVVLMEPYQNKRTNNHLIHFGWFVCQIAKIHGNQDLNIGL